MAIKKNKIIQDRIPTEPARSTLIIRSWVRKETPDHAHAHKSPVDPIKFIEVNQLKNILIDLLETPKETLETTPKAEIVDHILGKHMTQSKSPNLLPPSPQQVSPVLVTPSKNIPHYQPTSTSINYIRKNRTPKRRIATPVLVASTKPTARNALINTSDLISTD